jgi:hypothetical protein
MRPTSADCDERDNVGREWLELGRWLLDIGTEKLYQMVQISGIIF